MSLEGDSSDDDFAYERPIRHCSCLSDHLVEDPRKVFQRCTDRQLTGEDTRQVLENLTGFFSVLHEWDQAGRRHEQSSLPPAGEGKDRQIDK